MKSSRRTGRRTFPCKKRAGRLVVQPGRMQSQRLRMSRSRSPWAGAGGALPSIVNPCQDDAQTHKNRRLSLPSIDRRTRAGPGPLPARCKRRGRGIQAPSTFFVRFRKAIGALAKRPPPKRVPRGKPIEPAQAATDAAVNTAASTAANGVAGRQYSAAKTGGKPCIERKQKQQFSA